MKVSLLHYSLPPVIGGVEAVIQAHVGVLAAAGYQVELIAGRGDERWLPAGARLHLLPEVDSQAAGIAAMSSRLEQGIVPHDFEPTAERLTAALRPLALGSDHLIIHNVLTKHFNLPLTAALHRLIGDGSIRHAIAWTHDISWTSASSLPKLHPGHPWDLLRTHLPNVTYVTVSQARQRELAGLFHLPAEQFPVVYNGVDPQIFLGLSPAGLALVQRLGLLDATLILLMPVRVTRAKNIEYAIRVAAALKDLTPNPRVVLTGPPDPHDAGSMAYYRSLLALRRQLGVEAVMRFVSDEGVAGDAPQRIDERGVGELLRVSDVVFMPSHREGFGMPVLEAGLAGVPVVCSHIPAALEIGGADITRIDITAPAAETARVILELVEASPTARLRRKVRLGYTWEALFREHIRPLLETRPDA
ncbi:MAG: glycosyltransferase family 4 protein [Anaerolineae bacterium]|nr:glycosyltransferase family 4 protein [Anaerolineae bacterium]